MPIYRLPERIPRIDAEAWVAPGAQVIGEVDLAAGSSVWFGVVIRADNEPIRVGTDSNIQENSVLHVDPGCPLTIGNGVTVGHQAMLHGCTIGDNSLIGIQSVVLNRAVIGRNCLVGAGSLVTEGKTFPDGSLILGSPAKVVRPLTDAEIEGLRRSATNYRDRARDYHRNLTPWTP